MAAPDPAAWTPYPRGRHKIDDFNLGANNSGEGPVHIYDAVFYVCWD